MKHLALKITGAQTANAKLIINFLWQRKAPQLSLKTGFLAMKSSLWDFESRLLFFSCRLRKFLKRFFGPKLSIKCYSNLLIGYRGRWQADKHTNKGEKWNLFGRANNKPQPFWKKKGERIIIEQWFLSVYQRPNVIQSLLRITIGVAFSFK